MFRKFLFILCLFHINFIYAKDDPLTLFLEKLDSLKSTFTQTLINEEGKPLEKSTGIFYLKQPGKFHWTYQQPYSQQIISDGNSLWIYDEDLEQVTIRSINNGLSQTPAGIILGEGNLEEHFIQIDLGNIEGYDWIELTPRDLETEYRTIKIGFNGDELGMMVIDDNLGQTTRIDFQDVRKNPQLDATLFSLSLPENVDVIDEREIATQL